MDLGDELYQHARRKMGEALRKKSVRVALAGALGGFVIGEVGSGKTRETLGLKGTRETLAGEKMLRSLSGIAERHSTALLHVSGSFGESEAITAGAVGLVAGLAAAEVHRDAPPLDFKRRIRRVASVGDLVERAWKAEKIDIDDSMSADEKFKRLGDLINRLAVEGSYDPVVVDAATEACSVADGSVESYAQAVGQWVILHIRYCHDEEMNEYTDTGEVEKERDGSLEVFQEAGRTIESGYGDCDCRAILVASMLRTQGVWSYWRMISQEVPGQYTHIYNVVPLEDETELAIDTTPVQTPLGYQFMDLGWEPDRTSSLTVLAQPLPKRRNS